MDKQTSNGMESGSSRCLMGFMEIGCRRLNN